MKKLFLHIGTHKTGTTSLQQFSRKRHKLFARLGIYVPEPGPVRNAQDVEINLGTSAGGLHAIPKTIAQRDHVVLDAFLDAFENSNLDAAILSSEGFDSFEPQHIKFLAARLSEYKVFPILVLRHPIDLAISIYCSLGRISPLQGYRLIDPLVFKKQPQLLISKFWCSKKQIHKVSHANFIIRQIRRRVYDYQGICRDWSHLGKVKLFFYEESNDIVKEIFSYILQDNSRAMSKLKDLKIPRLRGSLPVPLAVMNNELYRGLNIDIKTYRKHVYPYIVKFSKNNKYTNIDFKTPVKKLSPFSLKDQNILLEKTQNGLDPEQITNYLNFNEDEKNKLVERFKIYRTNIDYEQISQEILKEVKTRFIQFCLPRIKFSL